MAWLLGGLAAAAVVIVAGVVVLMMVVRGGDDPNLGGTSPEPGDPRVVVSDGPGNTVRCTNVIDDEVQVNDADFEACINGGEGFLVEYASCSDGEDAATPQYDGQRYLIHVGSKPIEFTPPDPDC